MKRLIAIGTILILGIFNLSIFEAESYAAVSDDWELVKTTTVQHHHIEEHFNGRKGCLSQRLICEEDHEHTEECYEDFYSCGSENGQIMSTIYLYKEKKGSKYQLHLVIEGNQPTEVIWKYEGTQISTHNSMCNVTRNGSYTVTLGSISAGLGQSATTGLQYIVRDYPNTYTLTAPDSVVVEDGSITVEIRVVFATMNGKAVKVTFPDVFVFTNEDGEDFAVSVGSKSLSFKSTSTKSVTIQIPDLPKAGDYTANVTFTINSGNN